MQSTVRYQTETTTAMLGGRPITITDNTPILSPKERERRRKEVEQRLYDVFSKYTGSKTQSRFF
jgi:hypothetical protein